MPNAIILTSLPVEYMSVRKYLTHMREETHVTGTVYERGKFVSENRNWDVGIVEIGVNNSRSAVEAERAITHFNPSVALFVGVAGGIKDVDLGDVVVSTKVYGYESGKVDKTFKPRPNIGLSAYRLEQRARAEARKTDWLKRLPPHRTPCVFIAPIAAGEKVFTSTESELFQFLRSNYEDAIAVEMEGFGFLEATHANQGMDAIIIRGISDLIDNKTEVDKVGYQKIAAENASAFAFEILAKIDTSKDSEVEQKISTQILDQIPQQKLDYTQLTQLLAQEKWKEADQETARLMLLITQRSNQGFIDKKSLEKFPCSDLMAIDQLWQRYSNNYFGFTVQKRIYQIVKNTMKDTNNTEIWRQFGEKVGWRRNQRWINYSDLIVTNLLEGLLPASDYEGLGGVWFYDGLALFDRLDNCSKYQA